MQCSFHISLLLILNIHLCCELRYSAKARASRAPQRMHLISRLESRVGAVPPSASLKARVEDSNREMRRRSPSRPLPKRNLVQLAFTSRRSERVSEKTLVASFRISTTEPRDIVEAHASLRWRAWRKKLRASQGFWRLPKHQNEGFPLRGLRAQTQGTFFPQTAAKWKLVQPSACRILILLPISFVFLVDLGNIIVRNISSLSDILQNLQSKCIRSWLSRLF